MKDTGAPVMARSPPLRLTLFAHVPTGETGCGRQGQTSASATAG